MVTPIADKDSSRSKPGAVVWLATALVLLGCAWLLVGGITRLLCPKLDFFSYLPNFPALEDSEVLVQIVFSAMFAVCQMVAVMKRSVVYSFAIGGLLTLLSILWIICLCFVLAFPFHDDGDGASIDPFLIFVVACLVVGLVMLRWGWRLDSGARCA